MTVFHFKKKLLCNKNCHKNFTAQVVALCPSFEAGVNGHITILHSTPYHEIFVACYNTGKHENWSVKGIQYTPFNEIQKKWKGKLPTKAQLENL